MKNIADFFKSRNLVHFSFEIGILLKGLNGLVEIAGGFLLLYFNPGRLRNLIDKLTRDELKVDPTDLVANALIRFGHSFSIGTQTFGIVYLLSHGIVKCLLVFLLWRRKLWAYPLTVVSLIFFIVYQMHRYFIDQSVYILLLTIFDIIMIVLTILEYQRMKSNSVRRKQKQQELG